MPAFLLSAAYHGTLIPLMIIAVSEPFIYVDKKLSKEPDYPEFKQSIHRFTQQCLEYLIYAMTLSSRLAKQGSQRLSKHINLCSSTMLVGGLLGCWQTYLMDCASLVSMMIFSAIFQAILRCQRQERANHPIFQGILLQALSFIMSAFVFTFTENKNALYLWAGGCVGYFSGMRAGKENFRSLAPLSGQRAGQYLTGIFLMLYFYFSGKHQHYMSMISHLTQLANQHDVSDLEIEYTSSSLVNPLSWFSLSRDVDISYQNNTDHLFYSHACEFNTTAFRCETTTSPLVVVG